LQQPILSDITFTAYTAASQNFHQNDGTSVTSFDEDHLALVSELHSWQIFIKG